MKTLITIELLLCLALPVYGQRSRPTVPPPVVPFAHAPGPWDHTVTTIPQRAQCLGGIAYWPPLRAVWINDADVADCKVGVQEFDGAAVETTNPGMCSDPPKVPLPVRLLALRVCVPARLSNGMTFLTSGVPGPQRMCVHLSAWNVAHAVPEAVYNDVPICGTFGSKDPMDLWPFGQFAVGRK